MINDIIENSLQDNVSVDCRENWKQKKISVNTQYLNTAFPPMEKRKCLQKIM